jgi:two-component system response regulator FixJ
MSETPEPTVFVVDDDVSIRVALERALNNHGFAVETYESATAFIAGYEKGRPGCLVLDYGMPEISGLDLQEHLNKNGYRIPIIFITGHGGIPESVIAMKGGALDFLEKPFRQETLVERINAALRVDEETREKESNASAAFDRLDTLTEREREIAEFLVQNPAEASSKRVARILDISPRTVDHHRARVLEKMNVRSVAELVDLANKVGMFSAE